MSSDDSCRTSLVSMENSESSSGRLGLISAINNERIVSKSEFRHASTKAYITSSADRPSSSNNVDVLGWDALLRLPPLGSKSTFCRELCQIRFVEFSEQIVNQFLLFSGRC